MNTDYIGILPDPRSETEKAKDWRADELVSAGSITAKFRKVNKNEWKKYTLRDQDGSGSCVSQALAKGFEVLYKEKTGKTVMFSSTPIYQKRANKPAEGMYIHDAFGIAVKFGTCPEKDCPSQKMTNEQMDKATIPSNFEDLNNFLDAIAYLAMPNDFDYIAAWVEKYGWAQIHIAADRVSWSKAYPSLGSQNRGVRHAVSVVDAIAYKGVQYLVIEDSWGKFGEFVGQRLLARDVFADMFTSGAGFTVLEYDVTDVPKFAPFNTNMEYGQKSAEILRLQQYLQSRGYFPKDTECTGLYKDITALAVYNFQMAKKVASPLVLNKNKGKYCYEATRKAINADL